MHIIARNRQIAYNSRSMSFRSWLNLVTFVLIAVVLFFARDQLVAAWALLGQVNVWVLSLLIPVQFFVYYCGGEMIFSYLRGRGRLRDTSNLSAASMALELNFVNHVFPSGGVAGFSYMAWRLGKLDVSAGQATMAQVVRYVVALGSFIVLLAISLLFVTVDSKVSGPIVMMASIVVTAIVFLVLFGGYLIGKESRMVSFSHWLYVVLNGAVRKITFGHVKKDVLSRQQLEHFFIEFHRDFIELKKQKQILVRPIIWSFLFNIADVMLFLITFWALGFAVNPAVLLIAYGAASMAGLFVLTPGGAGAYEAIMVGILTAGGVPASTAFAGVILTRTILLLGTIAVGFVVYQRALRKYGKPPVSREKPAEIIGETQSIVAEDEDVEPLPRDQKLAKKFAKKLAEPDNDAEIIFAPGRPVAKRAAKSVPKLSKRAKKAGLTEAEADELNRAVVEAIDLPEPIKPVKPAAKNVKQRLRKLDE